MKKNKILSLIAAITLTAGTSMTPVFAEVGDTSASSDTDVSSFTISKTYNIVGIQAEAPAETFTFDISGGSEETAIDDATIEYGATKADGTTKKSTTVTLPSVEDYGNKPGEFTYTVTENSSAATPGVDYDSSSYTVKVTVHWNSGETALVRTLSIRKGNDKYTSCDFTNTYTAYSLTVRKSIKGALGDKDQKFAIDVDASNEDGDSILDVTPELNDYEKNPTTGSVTYYNLPKGSTYTVVETNSDGYQKSGEVTVDKEITEDTTETIVNTKGGTIDTGIITNNAPYIAIVGIVGVCAIVFFLRKRNVEE